MKILHNIDPRINIGSMRWDWKSAIWSRAWDVVCSFFQLFFFCVRGTYMSFFDYVAGNSPVQPLAKRGNVTTSRGKWEGSTTRGDTTSRRRIEKWWHVKRLWHDEKPRDTQPGEWEAKARQEVAVLAEASAEQCQRWVRQQSTKKRQRLWLKRQSWCGDGGKSDGNKGVGQATATAMSWTMATTTRLVGNKEGKCKGGKGNCNGNEGRWRWWQQLKPFQRWQRRQQWLWQWQTTTETAGAGNNQQNAAGGSGSGRDSGHASSDYWIVAAMAGRGTVE
jgi:hypothetical protein